MAKLPRTSFPEAEDKPLRKAVRRLRWFIQAYSGQISELSADTGIEFEIDRSKLRAVFLKWVKAFEGQKPSDAEAKANYITFAAGAMLRELVDGEPLKAVRLPEHINSNNPAHFWPEGYAHLAFCMNVRSAVIAQELDLETDIAPEFEHIRTWWSFKENACEDSATAIGFFELFVGDNPNWSAPQIFSAEHALDNAKRMFQRNADRLGEM